MVEHGLRDDARQRVWNVQAARIAQAEQQEYDKFIGSMDRFTRDILEEETVKPSTLKKILEK